MFESKTQTMKKIFVTWMGLTLGVGSMFAQDGGSSKWIGTLGVAPVVLDGTGLQLGFEKAVSNKLSVGLGFHTLSRKGYTDITPLGDQYFPNGSQIDANSSPLLTLGLNARYYLIGDNQDAKFGLYGGLGLGFSKSSRSFSGKNLLPETDTLFFSYDAKYEDQGLSLAITGGVDYKVGKGRLFLETQSLNMLTSTTIQTMSNGKGTMAMSNSTYEYKENAVFFWDQIITIGYRLRF